MKDPERLTTGDDVFTRKLLHEWDAAEQPTKRALRQSAATLGVAAFLGSTVGEGASSAATEGAALPGAGQGVAPAAAPQLGGTGEVIGKLGLVKWVGIGIVSGTVIAGGATHVANRARPPRANPSSVAAKPPTKPAPLDRMVRAKSERPAVAPRAGSDDAVPGRAVPKESGRFPDPAAQASVSLAAEIDAIDEARQAVADQRPDAALRALHRYRELKPSPVFQPEAALLRHEALQLKRGGKLKHSARK